MVLYELLHKSILIEFADGKEMRGYVDAYISAEDNDPDPESIIVISDGVAYEVTAAEIKQLSILYS